MSNENLVSQLREAVRRRGERPASERLEEMVKDGVIDRSGRVLIRSPEPPPWTTTSEVESFTTRA